MGQHPKPDTLEFLQRQMTIQTEINKDKQKTYSFQVRFLTNFKENILSFLASRISELRMRDGRLPITGVLQGVVRILRLTSFIVLLTTCQCLQ